VRYRKLDTHFPVHWCKGGCSGFYWASEYGNFYRSKSVLSYGRACSQSAGYGLHTKALFLRLFARMASREPVDEESRKAIRQRKREAQDADPPASPCPSCHSPGWLLHRTPTATYFICVNCEHKWHEENRE
jgi:hypothetical protein